MKHHREGIKEWLSTLSFDNVRIVDWGRGTKPVLRYIHTGENTEYFGIDKLSHVDAHLVADITYPNEVAHIGIFDVAFCMEALEHVKYPDKVIQNIYDHLRDGGMLYLSVPFLMDVHSGEDYWRFTDQGIRELLIRNGFHVERITASYNKEGWLVEAYKPTLNAG